MEKLAERQSKAETDIERLEAELAKLRASAHSSSDFEKLKAENERLQQRLNQLETGGQAGGDEAEERSQRVEDQELVRDHRQVEYRRQHEGGEEEPGEDVGEAVHPEKHPAAADQTHPHTAGRES